MPQRPWKHFEKRDAGECEIEIGGRTSTASYELGLVSTGRQRVHAGVELRIYGPDGSRWVGRDDWSPLEALRAAAALAQVDGVRLICSGLSAFFFQTGLSWGTPFGYYPWSDDPVQMMEPPEGPLTSDTRSSSNGRDSIN